MKKKTTLIFALILIVVSVNLKAADSYTSASAGEFVKVGAAGGQFLKIGVGARANSMAGAYTSVANDLTSLYWNPAGLADVKKMSADFSYTQWFSDFKHSYGAIALPIGENFTAAVHMISLNSDNIEITTVSVPEGTGLTYTCSDVLVGASFAGYLTDQFSFGVTFKYVNNGFGSVSSDGIAFDIGTMYQTGIQGIKLGFAISNLGTEQAYEGQDLKTTKKLYDAMYASPLDATYLSRSYSLPLIFRAGISSEIIKSEEHKLLVAGDFVTHSDVKEQFALGAEYTWNDLLMLRAGYRFGHDQFGFAGGVGVKYIGGGFIGQLDYSMSPTIDLGLVNRLSISMAIGE